VLERRVLARDEIREIWQIDRSERVGAVYALVDGELLLRPEQHVARGWPAGMPEPELFDLEPEDIHLEYDLQR